MTKNTNEKSLGYAIGKTNWHVKTLLNRHLHQLLKEEGFSITNEQWIVLKIIAANPGMSQTEIAEKSLKDKTNITRILDLLEKSAYIERQRDHNDRRMYRIHITDQGKKVLEAVNPLTKKIDSICTRSLNKKEAKTLIKSLDAVCAAINKEL